MNWLRGVPASRILLFLVIPILLYFGLGTGSWALREYQQRQEEARLKQEIEAQRAKYDVLKAQKEYLQSDEYIEKVAREDLNLIKVGERAVVVLAPSPVAGAAEEASPKARKTEPRPNWQRWWDLFFSD
ncbi:MAG: septum formation initiator family protein [Chloroflexi bacterium]|nr:septum formation initiator family protein [Chloroflexota bacterium]